MPSDVRPVKSSTAESHAWEIIEDCVFAFELDCQKSNRRPLDKYLPADGDEQLRQAVLIELVKVDLELQ